MTANKVIAIVDSERTFAGSLLLDTERVVCASCKALADQRDRVRLRAAVTRKKSQDAYYADKIHLSKIDEIHERLILLCMKMGEPI